MTMIDSMSCNSSAFAAPLYPPEETWYVRDGNRTDGPYDGSFVRAMIAQGRYGLDTPIARVGATEWSTIRDNPVFARSSAGLAALKPDAAAVHYAGFWIRLAAYLLDVVFVNIVSLATSFIVGFVAGIVLISAGSHPAKSLYTILGYADGILTVVSYHVLFNGGGWQATPGKRLLGIHIVTVNGEKLDRRRAFGRYVGYLISGLTLCIGFMMIGWTRQKQALHDMICKTRVVYGKL